MRKNFTCSSSGDQDMTAHSFIEISIDPSLLNNFANEDGMTAFFSTCGSTEEFAELKIELFQEVMRIVDECLTDKQKEVMKMTYIGGKTQNEISIELGKHQTAIHKTLHGNIDYNNQKKRYGGAIKKIKKLCATNEKIKGILLRMRKLSADATADIENQL